jgi:hypothetical protein
MRIYCQGLSINVKLQQEKEIFKDLRARLIHSFDLRDIQRVAELQKKGTAFNHEEYLTLPQTPLRKAILSLLLPQRKSIVTYLSDNRENGDRQFGMAQIRKQNEQLKYHVIFMAPALSCTNGAHAIWQRLLTQICVDAGAKSVRCLYVNLTADSQEFQIFRSMGFSTYAQEDIFFLREPSIQAHGLSLKLRPQHVRDAWALQRLYAAVTPRLTQVAEGSAQGIWEIRSQQWRVYGKRIGLIWEEQGEVLAAINLQIGKQNVWLRWLLHPDAADQAENLLKATLNHLPAYSHKPIFFIAREYDTGLHSSLQLCHFEPYFSQTLMVKHLTTWIRNPMLANVPTLEQQVESRARSAVTHLHNMVEK